MDQKTINAGAKAYALGQLGKEQFDNNKTAVRAISDDFKAGIKWCRNQLKKENLGK